MPFDLSHIKPLDPANLTDYHVHCDYSAHAHGTIAEYCEAALRRNLAEICFTTHYDTRPGSEMIDCFIRINSELKRGSPELLAPYVEDVRKAHDEFYGCGLSVKLGVEFGWWAGCEESAEKLKDMYEFDYMLCGLHEIDDINICSSKVDRHLARIGAEDLLREYYRRMTDAARTGLFDTLAHIGYYRRHGLGFYGDIMHTGHGPYLEEFFEALKSTGTGLEINTSALRHGLDDYYPSLSIITAAKRAGVTVARLGSDSHSPEQIGYDFEGAAPLVADYMPYYEE